MERRGVDPAKVHVIPIGATAPDDTVPAHPLPPELAAVDDGRPVVLLFGLLRPYKGVATLLDAWRGIDDAQLWIVGRPMMELPPMPAGVRLVPRYVSELEAWALYRRADIVTLPYDADDRIDQSGVFSHALGTGRAMVVSRVGGLAEAADSGLVRGVAPRRPGAAARGARRARRRSVGAPDPGSGGASRGGRAVLVGRGRRTDARDVRLAQALTGAAGPLETTGSPAVVRPRGSLAPRDLFAHDRRDGGPEQLDRPHHVGVGRPPRPTSGRRSGCCGRARAP